MVLTFRGSDLGQCSLVFDSGEACGGDRGNIGDFHALTLEAAERGCCETDRCEAFSFNNRTGNGVYKSNVNCGITSSDLYDGYSIRKAFSPVARSGLRSRGGGDAPRSRGGP